ncbi:MAG: xylosidase/arabinosidase [Verrucomicrobiae bacterium]|nr:xylosidase/arabinosidase [Verrucomicrobiae bacterium]
MSVSTGCGKKEVPAVEAAAPRVDASTLTGKVMCGYQGWFGTPGDGEERGWRHYRNQTSQRFEPGEAGIEFWPDMSELGEHERFDTEFRHADGRVAQVFSSALRDTVVRHFQWMEDYGIDGVFVQRFATEVTGKAGKDEKPMAETVNRILDNCRAGAERHGRTYAVMYDLTSMRAANIALVKEDWRRLVRERGILKDKSYQHHRGRPVVAVWGVGFGRGRDYGPAEVRDLIEFLKNDAECGGLTVMLGTSTYWREGGRDAGPFSEWEPVYRMADIISPWTVGRYSTPAHAREYATTRAVADREWCEALGKDFMPVVFPGFSWSNLKKGTDEAPDAFIDRDDGRFLWAQYDAHIREGGVKMIYQAMFDELDEGTHIFKSTNDPPVGASRFLTYGDLPSDHYLWLVGEAARRLRGELPSTPALPSRETPKAAPSR